jgi:hypothetical protein
MALLNGRAMDFLQAIRADKSRYARDQFKLIRTLFDRYGLAAVLEAVDFAAAAGFSAQLHERIISSTSAPPLAALSYPDYPNRR